MSGVTWSTPPPHGSQGNTRQPPGPVSRAFGPVWRNLHPKQQRHPHRKVLFGARKKTGPHKLTAQPPHCTGSTPCVPYGSSVSPGGTRLPCCGCARWGLLRPHLKAPILVRLSTTHRLACTKIAAGPWRPPTDPPGLDCSRCGPATVPGLLPGAALPQNAKAHWTPHPNEPAKNGARQKKALRHFISPGHVRTSTGHGIGSV